MNGTSRVVSDKLSGRAPGGSSRGNASPLSGGAITGTSRVSTTRGGQVIPDLLTGPTATPAQTTCGIVWTVDLVSYHRVHYRLHGGAVWIETAWSAAAELNANISLSGLTAGQNYHYEIKSDYNKTGKTEGWWNNAGIPFEFDTTGGFSISGVSFTVTKNSIRSILTTSETAGCRVSGCVYDPDEPPGEMTYWYNGLTPVHGTSHSHDKTGLAIDTLYAVRITARNGAGTLVYAPSIGGYYLVRTANVGGAGGGLEEIVP